MIRVAAVGDVHFGVDSAGTLRPELRHLAEAASVLLLAGDLTRTGTRDEARILAEELRDLPVPCVAVLGNHDFHADEPEAVRKELEAVGVHVLDGDHTQLELDGGTLGIAGTKGFGGGFSGASGSEFGEPEMKSFIAHTRVLADALRAGLMALSSDVRIALLHYSPVTDTLFGERLEIFPFLGSYLLAEAIDAAGADLVLHGHAHGGTEKGITPGGIHVRNVAQPVIRASYRTFCLQPASEAGRTPALQC